jgi:hypothetical protein
MVREDGDPMEPVQIGVRQLYDLMIALDGKLDSYIHAQEPRIALLDHRLTKVEEKQDKSSDRQWQLWLALIASGTAVVIAVFPLIVK